MKKIASLALVCCLLFSAVSFAEAEPEVNAKSAVLMEASTGRILYENNSHEKLAPASVTKIMTMLLTMEAIADGRLRYEDIVTASENAKSMGGSTIYLDTGEKMSVYDLLKGIAVASANDACVAIAEHLDGSVAAFVERMNTRAAELGMADTHFVNPNGLDDPDHYTSAHDIALMSQELLKHEDIFQFTTIWMDSLRDGKFQLANTNKLIRFYEGANGLKTGSTSQAGCCLSASAKRDNMQLIAVVMGAPNSTDRFEGAKNLLNYGFANYGCYTGAEQGAVVGEITVKKGVAPSVNAVASDGFSTIVAKGSGTVEQQAELDTELVAPVKQGQKVGRLQYICGGEVLGSVDLIAQTDVTKISPFSVFLRLLKGIMHQE